MRRRLDRDGETALATWIDRNDPDKKTRSLIAEAIDAHAANQGQIRFYSERDTSNPGVTVIQPAEGLEIHVQEADPGEFTCLRVIDNRD